MISEALQHVRDRIAAACALAQRPVDRVTLVAVSKTFPAEAVVAALDAGQRHFGENYVQEGVDKIARVASLRPNLIPDTRPVWHFIGPLQSNKSRLVAEHFDWVHSVDRPKIAQRLSEQRPAHLPPLNVCLQVNISNEASKSGFATSEVAAAALLINVLPRLRLRGLMCIPEPAHNLAQQRVPFRQMSELLSTLEQQGLTLDTLSMGMSADMDAAVAEGATMLRVGTAIFGTRDVKPSAIS